jgi:hypothetical protein
MPANRVLLIARSADPVPPAGDPWINSLSEAGIAHFVAVSAAELSDHPDGYGGEPHPAGYDYHTSSVPIAFLILECRHPPQG